jgi:DedD protein
MGERMKQRVIGAAVLVIAAVVFIPMLLDQGGEAPDQLPRMVPSPSPPSPPPTLPPQDTDVRVVPLDQPNPAPAAPAEPAPARNEPPAKAITPPAPPPPAPEKSAVKSAFAVQLGSFSKAGNALGLRDKLKAKGYRAFVKTSGSVTRVYVGPQKNRAEAEKALKKLLADTKLKGIVVKVSG